MAEEDKPMGRGNGAAAGVETRACPICGKPRVHEFRPFCSKRCADIDLGRWLKGAYVVAGEPDADEDGGPTAEKPQD
jgi:endogenous inhibitor of DNA gyrase (YacG/DUF329 family)